MGNGLRYTMTHLGDFFVAGIEKAWLVTKKSTRGITLTYDIQELGREKKKLQRLLGERLAELKKSSPENEIFEDEKLARLFGEFDAIEQELKKSMEERDERLYPGKPFSQEYA